MSRSKRERPNCSHGWFSPTESQYTFVHSKRVCARPTVRAPLTGLSSIGIGPSMLVSHTAYPCTHCFLIAAVHVVESIKGWPGARNDKHQPQATHERQPKCLAGRRGVEATLMKVVPAGDERPGRCLESAFFDWPSRFTHWEH